MTSYDLGNPYVNPPFLYIFPPLWGHFRMLCGSSQMPHPQKARGARAQLPAPGFDAGHFKILYMGKWWPSNGFRGTIFSGKAICYDYMRLIWLIYIFHDMMIIWWLYVATTRWFMVSHGYDQGKLKIRVPKIKLFIMSTCSHQNLCNIM